MSSDTSFKTGTVKNGTPSDASLFLVDNTPDGNIVSTIGSKADMSSTNHSIPNSDENVNGKSDRGDKGTVLLSH